MNGGNLEIVRLNSLCVTANRKRKAKYMLVHSLYVYIVDPEIVSSGGRLKGRPQKPNTRGNVRMGFRLNAVLVSGSSKLYLVLRDSISGAS